MKNIFLILFLLTGLLSCNNAQTKKTENEAKDNLYKTPSDDKEMNEAIATAKKTLDQFDKALESNIYDTSTFALKVRFPTSTGGEHIWVTSIIIKDGDYFGIVDNLPELKTNVKFGDKIKLDKKNISDWMYSDKGILRGGYTIKLIRGRMTKEEQGKFDANFPFKIEN
jgi:uncharacterized protein YegJ (DUF2314 family)